MTYFFLKSKLGTGTNDANFVIKNANDNIKKLETERMWILKFVEDNPNTNSNTNVSFWGFWDLKFNHEINKLLQQAEQEYDKMDYQKVVFYAFTEMINSRKSYFANATVNVNLVHKYIRLFLSMLNPIIPGFVEQFGVNTNSWPCVEKSDPMMEFKIHLFNNVLKIVNHSIDRRLKKTQTPFTLQLTVYSRFNTRQTEMIQAYPEQPKDPNDKKFYATIKHNTNLWPGWIDEYKNGRSSLEYDFLSAYLPKAISNTKVTICVLECDAILDTSFPGMNQTIKIFEK